MPVEPVLLIHGGATNLSSFPNVEATSKSLDRIVLDASALLSKGATALETVARAVELLELDPLFNAGYGSKLPRDGVPRLSASAMDGPTRRFGAVINVQNLIHVSQLALHLLESEDRVLDAEAADALADELGLPRESAVTERRRQEWQQAKIDAPYGTVGAVALDRQGRLAALTSTGGKGFERPGRVSDSATVAGNYADHAAAVSCTGIGEDIMDVAVGPRLAAWIDAGLDLNAAADRLVAGLEREGRALGFIAVDAYGATQARFSTQCMTHRIWKGSILAGWPEA